MAVARFAFALVGFSAGVLAITAVLAPAEAQRRRDYRDAPPRYVVAESRFGHGRVEGPVRMSSQGPQVRLPGGSWVYCGRSCSETLRVESVDFWENQGQHPIDNTCGLFGCLSVRGGF